mmetsp:Transcript_138050/g.440349  ORF Transcript_138050/g.440349 Transcript_138050/m.440349 type:complete len:274 (+) Transcript_138050:801-1622(+)
MLRPVRRNGETKGGGGSRQAWPGRLVGLHAAPREFASPLRKKARRKRSRAHLSSCSSRREPTPCLRAVGAASCQSEGRGRLGREDRPRRRPGRAPGGRGGPRSARGRPLDQSGGGLQAGSAPGRARPRPASPRSAARERVGPFRRRCWRRGACVGGHPRPAALHQTEVRRSPGGIDGSLGHHPNRRRRSIQAQVIRFAQLPGVGAGGRGSVICNRPPKGGFPLCLVDHTILVSPLGRAQSPVRCDEYIYRRTLVQELGPLGAGQGATNPVGRT